MSSTINPFAKPLYIRGSAALFLKSYSKDFSYIDTTMMLNY